MKRMKLSELTGNEILAQSLMTWDYQIILPEGVVLKKEYISKIEEMGILEVYVKEDQANEIVILKNDIEKTIKNKVKSILERHTYQNNKELQGLTQAADEIITNILDEKEVIEKVFDIRERSADIYEHSISLSSMAILTALRLKLDKSVIHDIGVGCLLHDIGLRYTTLDYEDKSMEDMKPEALAAMQAGDLDVTVFQDAAGQGKGSLDAALKLAKGEKIDKKVYIPFQLVTPENVKDFVTKN